MGAKTWQATVMSETEVYKRFGLTFGDWGTVSQIAQTQAEITWDVAFTAGQEAEKEKFKELCAHCDTPLLKEGEQYERIKQEGYNQALMDIKEAEHTKPDENRLLPDDEVKNILDNLIIKVPVWDDQKEMWVDGELWQKYNALLQAQLAKDMEWEDKYGFIKEAECEACIDGFISTHEKATNEVRAKLEAEFQARENKTDAEWKDVLSKALALRDTLCQARVGGIFKEGEEACPHWINKRGERKQKRHCPGCWQASKEREGVK